MIISATEASFSTEYIYIYESNFNMNQANGILLRDNGGAIYSEQPLSVVEGIFTENSCGTQEVLSMHLLKSIFKAPSLIRILPQERHH